MAIEIGTYPQLRTRREVASAGAGGAPGDVSVSLPRPRAFWFKVEAGIDRRSTISTGPIHGPALIRMLAWGTGGPNNANVQHLQLGVSLTPIEEVSVVRTLPKPFRELIEQMDRFPSGVTAGNQGYPSDTVYGSGGEKSVSLPFIVTDTEFRTTVTLYNGGGASQTAFGVLSIVESVPLEALASFQ